MIVTKSIGNNYNFISQKQNGQTIDNWQQQLDKLLANVKNYNTTVVRQTMATDNNNKTH